MTTNTATVDRRVSVKNQHGMHRAIRATARASGHALVRFCAGTHVYVGAPVPGVADGVVFFGARVGRGVDGRCDDAVGWCNWIVFDDQNWMMLVDGDDLLRTGHAVSRACPIAYVEPFNPEHHPADFFDVFSASAMKNVGQLMQACIVDEPVRVPPVH